VERHPAAGRSGGSRTPSTGQLNYTGSQHTFLRKFRECCTPAARQRSRRTSARALRQPGVLRQRQLRRSGPSLTTFASVPRSSTSPKPPPWRHDPRPRLPRSVPTAEAVITRRNQVIANMGRHQGSAAAPSERGKRRRSGCPPKPLDVTAGRRRTSCSSGTGSAALDELVVRPSRAKQVYTGGYSSSDARPKASTRQRRPYGTRSANPATDGAVVSVPARRRRHPRPLRRARSQPPLHVAARPAPPFSFKPFVYLPPQPGSTRGRSRLGSPKTVRARRPVDGRNSRGKGAVGSHSTMPWAHSVTPSSSR